jgi:hypothetical protein
VSTIENPQSPHIEAKLIAIQAATHSAEANEATYELRRLRGDAERELRLAEHALPVELDGSHLTIAGVALDPLRADHRERHHHEQGCGHRGTTPRDTAAPPIDHPFTRPEVWLAPRRRSSGSSGVRSRNSRAT